MIRIPCSQLEAGMELASPVKHPGVVDHALLRAGYRFDVDMIKKLERFPVKAVWIRHPGFDFLDDKLRDAIPKSRRKLYHSIKRSFTGIANKTSGAFDLIEYRTVVGNMIMSLIANKNHAVWAERLIDCSNELFEHSANTAYLTLVIGMRIKDYICQERRRVSAKEADDLTNLGIGAMLHDLGKLGLDTQWHDVHFFQDRADSDDYRGHPERGYRAVQGRLEATAAVTVLHHHQRFDGHGFPRPEAYSKTKRLKKMEGHDIHIFSRVVAVANTLDGLMGAHQKAGLPTVAALASLNQPRFEGMFDPVVLDAALRAIPPFPLGACVELSDGRQAVVIGLNETTPCQPTVLILDQRPGEDTAPEELDLTKPNAPSIAKYDDHTVDQFYYALPA